MQTRKIMAKSAGRGVPSYSELVRGDGLGTVSSAFGDNDQLGTVNFCTPERVSAAAKLISRGAVFNLDYPVNAFQPFPTGRRPEAQHHIFANNPTHRDDYLDSFYLQGTSQIDGLRHMRHPVSGFYGGVSDAAVVPGSRELGIQAWAETGIVGRGVLLDVERILATEDRQVDHERGFVITVDDLERTAVAHGVDLRPGDILLIRTGWADYYLNNPKRAPRAARRDPLVCPGLDQSERTVQWLWDHQFSLIASDNMALEVLPPLSTSPFFLETERHEGPRSQHDGMMHRVLIPLLGMAIGELWALEELATDCLADGVYDFFLTAKPLYLIGGVGSPPNAVAIK